MNSDFDDDNDNVTEELLHGKGNGRRNLSYYRHRNNNNNNNKFLLLGLCGLLCVACNIALSAVLLFKVVSIEEQEGSNSVNSCGNVSNSAHVDVASFFRSTSVTCGYPCATLCFGRGQTVSQKTTQKSVSNSDLNKETLSFQECFDVCYDTCQAQKPSKAALASYLRKDAVHHAGLTVSNLTRSVFFYTQILGGIEVHNAGGDGWFGDEVQQLLTQKELLQGKREGKSMKQMQVADLFDNGTDTLSARYISFGGVTVELLDYRARNASYANLTQLPYDMQSSSPSVVNAMHLCFLVEDGVDLNEFVNTLESVTVEHGVPVTCNRIVPMANEAQRKAWGVKYPQYNAFHVRSGVFEGWALAYCKGPDGEQLEFAQAILKAKEEFGEAAREYMASRG